ncbi:MAG: hypothetical protein GXP40_00730, partial [Chloroflexi bacterium]|nr:hypothetical protein [Chloroflexota bacterium]
PSADGAALPEPPAESPPLAPGGAPPTPGNEPPRPGPGPRPDPRPEVTDVEVEAYELWVRDVYESISCYVRLGDEAPRLYEFDALGDLYWDIADALSGENSVRILHDDTTPLSISVECWGSNAGAEPVLLGQIAASHPPGEWDGRDLYATSGAFSVRYRICLHSCDESDLPAPLLAPVTLGPIGEGPYTLGWQWRGDEAAIDGFGLVVSARDDISVIDIPDAGMRSLDVADYRPACGETVYFQLYAYQDDGAVRSPMSNTQYWPGDVCAYTARVTFMTLDVHDPPEDEGHARTPGPIYGEFWVANGTARETLTFDGCWCYFGPGMTFWGWCEGLNLQQGVYAIQRDIFGWIEREQASCIGQGCASYSYEAPFTSSLVVSFEDGEDITVGGRIMDCDARANYNDLLYEEQETVLLNIGAMPRLSDPILRTLNGDYVDLEYFIRLGR